MHLEVVSHRWNYSRLLMYQLSSLVLHPVQQTDVTMTVFYSADDLQTCAVLDFFGDLPIERVVWRWWKLPTRHLLRRAIGRNLAALESKADWLWFADADMCFFNRCLDSIWTRNATILSDPAVKLVFPKSVYMSKDHESGDQAIESATGEPRVLKIDTADFAPEEYERAIGGVQICRADVLRETAYCKDHTRFMRPTRKWRVTYEDRHFRRNLGTAGVPVDVESIYRIRHSRCGREYEGLQL
jgi:hypothetical protein